MKRLLLSAAVLALAAIGVAQAVQITGTNSENRRMVMRMGFEHLSVMDPAVAFAGGGQASATQLDSAVNRVTTVATAGDSVKLPSCQAGLSNTGVASAANPTGNTIGLMLYVINATATNSMNVFPQTSQAINNNGANAAFGIAANLTVQFICGAAGQWYTIPKVPS